MAVWVTRELAAPAESAWALLTDTTAWPRWGPTIAAVECDDRFVRAGSRGRVRAVAGPWLPFEVSDLVPGRSWRWRVAGVPATAHRVEPIGPGRCRTGFRVPALALPYAVVCWSALRRMADELEPPTVDGGRPGG